MCVCLIGKKICADYISSHTGAFDIETAGAIVVSVEDSGPGRLLELFNMLFFSCHSACMYTNIRLVCRELEDALQGRRPIQRE